MESGTPLRRHPQGGVSTLLIVFIACVLCSSIAHAAATSAHFDIPAGDAEQTLQQFLAQSKFPTLYLTDDVRGVTTKAIAGDYHVRDALRQMLDGTDLEVLMADDESSVAIRPTKVGGPPTPDAVTLIQDHLHARGSSGSADTEYAHVDEPELEEVVVTGTLIHGVTDIMSPLLSMTRKEMNQSSYATVPESLRQLPINFGGAPSENIGTTGNFGRGTAANLRGLGAGATLVLINGRRQPYSGTEGDFVDVSSIPTSAIDRIEVLPDGASALYGSDAIAGVVNVILKKDFAGGETQGRIGASPSGANEKLFSQMSGVSWNSGTALISYQFSERTALAAADRAYLATMDKRALGGSDHRTTGSVPGNILDPATFLPAFGINPGEDGASSFTDTINLQNRWASYDVLPIRRTHSVFLTGSQKFNDRLELFGEALLSKRDTSQQLFGSEFPLFVPASNPFFLNPYPDLPFVVVSYNFLNDLGPMHSRTTSRTYSGTLGIKVAWENDWRLTLAESHGRDRMKFSVDNQPDPVALDAALADPDPATAFNPFGNGLRNNPDTLEKIRISQIGSAASVVKTTSVVSDGPIKNLSSGQVKLALGAEWREETLNRDVFTSASFARKVNSLFTELSVPVLGDREDEFAVPRLELSLAGRFESYSDFGTTTNPKIGLRWAPFRSVKVRTSWGTSFRAPKLVDLYNSAQNVAGLRSVPDPRSPSGTSVVLQSFGNNPHLKEETASTWTAGLDLAPTSVPGLRASLTYYVIEYENQVTVPSLVSQNDILVEEAQWTSRIVRNPSLAAINEICNSPIFTGQPDQCGLASIAAIVDFGPQNLAQTRLRGIDLKLDQSLDTRYGKFDFGLNGAYVLSFDRAGSSTSPMIDVLNTVENPLRFKMRATAEWFQHAWDLPGFGLSAAVSHAGGYDDVRAHPNREVSAWTTTDLRVSYRTALDRRSLNQIEIGLNAANVFDRAPPFVDNEGGYDPANALPYGRVISFSIQKRW
jgi:iron complex outermembrane recepter protein